MDQLRRQIRSLEEREDQLRDELWAANFPVSGEGLQQRTMGGPSAPPLPEPVTSHHSQDVIATGAIPPCPSQQLIPEASSFTGSWTTGASADPSAVSGGGSPHVPGASPAPYTVSAPYESRQGASLRADGSTQRRGSPSCHPPSCMWQRLDPALSSSEPMHDQMSALWPPAKSLIFAPAAAAPSGHRSNEVTGGSLSSPPRPFEHHTAAYSTGESQSESEIPQELLDFILSHSTPAATSSGDATAPRQKAVPSSSGPCSPPYSPPPIVFPTEQVETSYSWDSLSSSAFDPSTSGSPFSQGIATASTRWRARLQQQRSFRSHDPESDTAFEPRQLPERAGTSQSGKNVQWSPVYSPPAIHTPPEQERDSYWWYHPTSRSSVGSASATASSGHSGRSSTLWPTVPQLSQPFFRRHPLDTDSASKQRYPLILGLASQTGERKVER
ncbi:UNVERIFIED_CONTAM: hypothetical protein HHA_250115 [Hammondia hammondi]|eukprot:XP_008888659.1 hypothetical protein HHA_250115 [Hammondia hammondi]